MKTSQSPDDLARLQAVLDFSSETASASVAASVAEPSRTMNATELTEFWESVGLVAMTTVGASGQPHSAPVHARLLGDTLSLVIYEDTVRRRDLRHNPRVAFTTWSGLGTAVILYGRAEEVPGSLRDARPAASGKPRKVVEILVRLTRVYAMGPRRDQSSSEAPPDGSVRAT